jgi:hypothetical protein
LRKRIEALELDPGADLVRGPAIHAEQVHEVPGEVRIAASRETPQRSVVGLGVRDPQVGEGPARLSLFRGHQKASEQAQGALLRTERQGSHDRTDQGVREELERLGRRRWNATDP